MKMLDELQKKKTTHVVLKVDAISLQKCIKTEKPAFTERKVKLIVQSDRLG